MPIDTSGIWLTKWSFKKHSDISFIITTRIIIIIMARISTMLVN